MDDTAPPVKDSLDEDGYPIKDTGSTHYKRLNATVQDEAVRDELAAALDRIETLEAELHHVKDRVVHLERAVGRRTA